MENISDSNNYFKNLNYSVENIINNYLNLLKTYVNHTKKHETNIGITNKTQNFYNRGIQMLMIIFMIMLKKTNNLELTYYHCEKAIFYYIEFYSQISNKNSFISLTSNDAIMFVYKKTIYLITKYHIDETEESKAIFNKVNILLKISNILVLNNDLESVFSDVSDIICKSECELSDYLNNLYLN